MATKKPAGALVKWEEQLAKQAAIAAGMEESTATGQFFGLKSGVLTFNDAPLPDNQMAVIILDHVLETVFYEGEFDTDNPQSPTAFAFGRDEKTLTWHETSHPDFAGKLCSESEVCEWGSAPRGRGKAARETRRLAMIPAGTLDSNGKFKPFTDADHYEKAQIAYMKLPVTSVKGFSGFVKQIAGSLRRPPFGIFTKVKVVPDADTQFKVVFEALQTVPDTLMAAVFARHEEATTLIEFPYQIDDEPKKKPTARKPAARGGAKPAGRAAPAKSAPRGRSKY